MIIKVTLIKEHGPSHLVAERLLGMSEESIGNLVLVVIEEGEDTMYQPPFIEHGSNVMSGHEACIDYIETML
jgi:hypothetical protein